MGNGVHGAMWDHVLVRSAVCSARSLDKFVYVVRHDTAANHSSFIIFIS